MPKICKKCLAVGMATWEYCPVCGGVLAPITEEEFKKMGAWPKEKILEHTKADPPPRNNPLVNVIEKTRVGYGDIAR